MSLAIETEIAGLYEITIPVHGDERGWFKENWQTEKMAAAGFHRSISFSRTSLSMPPPE